MNQLTNADKIACCNICLLSAGMKVCKDCPFNPAHMKLSPAELDTVSHIELLKVQVKP